MTKILLRNSDAVTTDLCPTCGQAMASPERDPVADKFAELTAACRERDVRVTLDGFVCEATAAQLIGVEPATLRNWRGQHAPLAFRRLGGPRGRVWYPLREIARFLVEPS